MNLYEKYLHGALLIFAIGLVASLMIPREYVLLMAIVIIVLPLWAFISNGIDHARYLADLRRHRSTR